MKAEAKYILLTLVLVLCGCTERIDWELDYQEMDMMVVEAKITNERRAHEVKLSWPVYEVNTAAEPVHGAVVEIYDRNRIYPFTEDPARPGIYLSDPGFAGVVDQAYQLRISYEDFRITAVTRMVDVGDWPNMNIYRVQQDPPLFEVYIGGQNGPSVIRFELDWSHVRGYENLPPEETHALIYHYSLSSVDVNRIFAPDREHVRFPPGTIVYMEKESVSPFYEEFLRGMLSETDWRGGVFDVQPGNALSNLQGGALGYFTAAAVLRDTVVVN